MRSELRRQRVDVIHAFMASTAAAASLARRFASPHGPALVVAPPGVIQSRDEPQWMSDLRLRLLVAGADLVIAPSKGFRHVLERVGVASARIREVEFNAVPIERFAGQRGTGTIRRELQIEPDARVVCSLARLHPVKGQDLLLRAAAIVAASEPDARFVFVGGGSWRATLEAIARDLGLEKVVRFAGERQDTSQLLGECDLVVQTTFGMGGPGLSVLEAFAASRPVVAYEFDDLREAIGRSGAALLVPHGDIPGLAAAITRVLRDPGLAHDLAARGHELVRSRFDLSHALRSLEDVYREGLEMRARLTP
jgi:glycosyltransferase involved in cell wall biosynthesis